MVRPLCRLGSFVAVRPTCYLVSQSSLICCCLLVDGINRSSFDRGGVRKVSCEYFRDLPRRPGFRWLVWSVILAVVIYSAWKAIYAAAGAKYRLESFVYWS